MASIKTDINNEILINAVKKLRLRFPVAEIERATGFGKSAISGYLKNKVPVSDAFLKKFSEVYKIDLGEFGYKLENQLEQKKSPFESDLSIKDHYEKLLKRYEDLADHLQKELDFERSKKSKD